MRLIILQPPQYLRAECKVAVDNDDDDDNDNDFVTTTNPLLFVLRIIIPFLLLLSSIIISITEIQNANVELVTWNDKLR